MSFEIKKLLPDWSDDPIDLARIASGQKIYGTEASCANAVDWNYYFFVLNGPGYPEVKIADKLKMQLLLVRAKVFCYFRRGVFGIMKSGQDLTGNDLPEYRIYFTGEDHAQGYLKAARIFSLASIGDFVFEVKQPED